MTNDTLVILAERLNNAAAGLHWLNEPATGRLTGLPSQLATLYQLFDGAELFHGSMVLFAAADVTEADGRVHFGRIEQDNLYLDASGHVWRLEADSGELLQESSRFHRWLFGFVEAEAVMYDSDGEFAEDIFGDDGLPTPEFAVRKERALLKRDKDAIASRWRLARALSQQDRLADARDELELVVARQPAFSWAWYDLARISETLGATDNAIEEMETAATADPSCEYRGFFYAHCARLAQLREDESARQAWATKALELDPNLVRAHLDGTCERLDLDDAAGAQVLIELALALAPLDLAALDLRVQVQTALRK